MLVCKFGGSSLADAGCFARVRDIVRADSRRGVIVVSAPGKRDRHDAKITDLLMDAALAREGLPAEVRRRYTDIARGLGLPDPEEELCAMERHLAMGPAAASSRGEWLCARLLAAYLGMPFIDAADVFVFRDGSPLEEASCANLRRMCGKGAVIPGFYGRDGDGNIALFPRGGSDICGAWAAEALNAEAYENWTDVDGIYAADPALVPPGAPIPAMSYGQARLLASMGAGVLHPDSVFPAERAGIPIIIKNTFAPEKAGTRISAEGDYPFPCMAARKTGDMGLLGISGVSAEQYGRICAALDPGTGRTYACGVVNVVCPAADVARTAAAVWRAVFGR